MLNGKHIIVGITGGIAAYKMAYCVRELRRTGAEVRVVMTPSAAQFVTPLTFATLSGNEVVVHTFPPDTASGTDRRTAHIELGLWGDAMLIAPASANTIAKIAHGIADNFLTTLTLALRCPLILAPAMDADMWTNDATRENLARLKERGCFVIEPKEGPLASGLTGPGRLPEVEEILAELDAILSGLKSDLKGVKVLVTAGPTEEPVDPVRFIGNRSSGRMGFAIALAASRRGADVTLVSGPCELETPRNVERVDIVTAGEMREAVLMRLDAHDVLVMAAAVADFTPAKPTESKIKKSSEGGLTLELKPTADILQEVASLKKGQVIVGFALETDDDAANARKKLSDKKLDFIVLNNPLTEGAGFGTTTNVVTFLYPDGRTKALPKMPKYDVAWRLLDRVAAIRGGRS